MQTQGHCKLIARVNAELILLRRDLAGIAMRSNLACFDIEDEVIVTAILHKCRLILDRSMNAVWKAHNKSKASLRKPNVYFPCKGTVHELEAELKRYKLCLLKRDNPKCYEAIKRVQPFNDLENNWLKDLFVLTKTKHESYVDISSELVSVVQIGHGQSGTIKQILFDREGRVYTNAAMMDSITGEPTQLKLSFTERFMHLLEATCTEPATYCAQCIDNVDRVFQEILDSLN